MRGAWNTLVVAFCLFGIAFWVSFTLSFSAWILLDWLALGFFVVWTARHHHHQTQREN
jgi:hypothetical protein